MTDANKGEYKLESESKNNNESENNKAVQVSKANKQICNSDIFSKYCVLAFLCVYKCHNPKV